MAKTKDRWRTDGRYGGQMKIRLRTDGQKIEDKWRTD